MTLLKKLCFAFVNLFLAVTAFPQNNPPYLEPVGDFKVKEGGFLSISLQALDLDNDPLTFSAGNLPAGATFDDTLGVLFWNPDHTQYGTYSGIHFEVSDGQGGIDSENVTVNVIHWPPGDVTGNGLNTLGDVITLINYIFNKPGNWTPVPLHAGDFNRDGNVTLADVIYDVGYIFRGGPAPKAKPEIWITHPPRGKTLNERSWLNVENMTGRITPGSVSLHYSTDSVNYFPLMHDTITNPFYIFDTIDVNGLWDPETHSSGLYYIKAVYADTDQSLSASAGIIEDETKVRVNRGPRPEINFFYDSLSGQTVFVCQAVNDPESDTILRFLWHFRCDNSYVEGPIAFKHFFQPETCFVSLEVRDQYQNVGTAYGTLYYTPPTVTWDDSVFDCQCESLAIITSGEIPRNGGIFDTPGTSKLQYPQEKKHPNGSKKLGTLDHTTVLANGGTQKAHIALYFMVEAKINGTAEKCSTLQMVNGTIKFNGGSGGPEVKDYVRPEDKNKYPYKSNPTKAELGVKVAYTTPCGGKGKEFIEKKDGVIRWICTPGIHVAEEKDKAENISVGKNFDELFKNNGVEFNMFFWVEVIDNLHEVGCITGKCKKCFLFGFKYDKDKGRQDVTGDGQPDPPTIIQYVPCPTSLR